MVFLNVYGYKLCVPVSIWLLHYIVRAGRYPSLLNELLHLLPILVIFISVTHVPMLNLIILAAFLGRTARSALYLH